MEEENVNDFTQSPISTVGTPSFSQNILPGLFGGFQAMGSGIANRYEREAAEDKKKEEKLKKQNAAWMDQLYDMPLTYEKDMSQVRSQVDQYNNWILNKKMSGADLNNLSDADILEKKRMEFELAKAVAITKDNQVYIDNLRKVINEDQRSGKYQYDGEKAAQFISEFENAASLEERMKLRNEKNPLAFNFDIDDLVDLTIPGESLKDTGRTETRYRDEAVHGEKIKQFINESDKGMAMYKTLAKAGETEDDFVKRVVAAGQQKYPKQTKVQPAPSGSGDDEKKEQDIVISGQSKEPDAKWDQRYSVNKVSVGKMKPVYVRDPKGNPVMNFVPADGFYLTPGGAVTAIGYGTIEEVQLDGTKLAKQIQLEVDYDTNKENFTAQGYPNIFDEFRARSGGGSTAAKTIKRSDIAAKAKASGYSNAEYEKLLIEKGVKIVD